MQLGKAAEYAMFATVYIARHEKDGPVQGRDAAEACGIAEEDLLKILQQLVRSQVLRSERGRSGGFRLRKTPSQTTLLEILEAMHGPVTGESAVRSQLKSASAVRDHLNRICDDVAQYTRSVLKKTTVRKLMNFENPRARARVASLSRPA